MSVTLLKDGKTLASFVDITERKLAEDALKESEAKLNDAMKIAKLSTWEYNFALDRFTFPDQSFSLFNTTAEQEGGYTMSSEHFAQKYIYPDDRVMIQKEIRKALETPDPAYTSQMEYRVIYAPGEIGYFAANVRIEKDADNRTVKALGVNQDITERKRIGDALLRINKAVESSSEAICMSDPQGHHFYHNKAFTEIFEYTLEEVEAAGGSPAIYENKDIAHKIFDTIMGGGSWNGEVEMLSKSGRKFTVLLHADAITDVNGVIVGLVGMHRDITERKQIELTLVERENFLDTLLNAIPIPVFYKDKNGRYLGFNKAYETFFDCSSDELIGKTVFEQSPKELAEIYFAKDNELLKSREEQHYESKIKTKYNLTRDVIFDKAVFTDNKGNVDGIIGTILDITDRKRIEESLRLFRTLLDKSNDAIEVIDVETGQFIDVNERACTDLGYSRSELLNLKVFDIDPDQTPEIFQSLMDGFQLSNSTILETLHQRKDGTTFPVEVNVTLVQLEKMYTIAIVRDITERKKLETNLSTATEIAKLGYWEFDVQSGNFIFDDQYYRLIHGSSTEKQGGNVMSAEEFAGRLVHPDDSKMIAIKLQEAISSSDPDYLGQAEARVLRDNGEPTTVTVQFKVVKDSTGRTIKVVGINQDITERKLAEEEIHQSNVFRDSLLKTIPFGMDIVDESGTVLFQSDNLKELVGENSIATKCWEFYKDDHIQCSNCPLRKGINIGKTDVYESNGVLGGRVFEVIHTGMMYKGKKALLEIFQDITERKEKEKELLIAKERAEESDRLKSAFLANMSHEIRTPMNGILGFTELLKEPMLSGEEQQQYIDIIEESGKRLLNIINDIVNISRIESGKVEISVSDTNVNELIDYVYRFFKPEAEEKKLHISYSAPLPNDEVVIKTDREKVYVVFTNLVKNAIKFTDKGSIEFGYQRKGKFLEFFVKDSGPGIHSEQKEIIFERFRQGSESLTRTYEGAGLGLSISKAYVEMLGGKIWVENNTGSQRANGDGPEKLPEGENGGAAFYFTIPISHTLEGKNIVETGLPNNRLKNQVRKLKILIAEDDAVSEKLMSFIVRNFAKEILNVNTGIQAVETCRSNPDIDLILMDIKMPGMDGYEATRQIRAFNKEVIIIAQTAYGFAGDREKAIKAGCNDYTSKPIDKDALNQIINSYF